MTVPIIGGFLFLDTSNVSLGFQKVVLLWVPSPHSFLLIATHQPL